VSTISADGTKLPYSTLLGGNGWEVGQDVEVDRLGRIHVVGMTDSDNFPTTTGAPQSRLKGYSDGFYTILLQNLTDVVMSTYVGGNEEEEAMGVEPMGGIDGYITGVTYSTDFPTTTGAYQTRSGGGGMDGFVSHLTFDSIPPIAVAGDDIEIDQHQTANFDGTACSDNIEVVNWTWKFRYGDEDIELYGNLTSYTFHMAGIYTVTLSVTDRSNLRAMDDLVVTVRDITSPEADAGNTRYIDQHETVVFNGLDSSDNVGIVNWTWSFIYGGGPVILYGPDPEFTFDDAGEYNVTLMVLDAMDLWATDWVTIYVQDITSPTANAGGDIIVDQHVTATLDGTLSMDNVGIANWTWGFVYRGAPVSLFGDLVEFTFDDAGEFEVTLSVEDGEGNRATDTITVTVKDITPPDAVAGADEEINQGSTHYFDASASTDNVRIASYNWTFDYLGVPILLEGSSPMYFFELAGVFEVTLTVTDLSGNEATDTITVTVLDTEPPVADAGNDREVDQGTEVIFDASSSIDNLGIVSYGWTFFYGDQVREMTEATFRWTFDEAGSFDVTLRIEDAAGYSDTDTVRVTVNDITPPVANAGDDRTVDQGDLVALDASASTDNVDIVKWLWSFDYGGFEKTLTGRTDTFAFEVPGDYTITLSVEDAAGNSQTDSFELHVRDTVLPVVPRLSDIDTASGDKVTFDASNAVDNVGIVKWTWTFEEDGKTVTLDGQTVEHTFDKAGDYTVTLTVEDAEGNQASTTFEVHASGGLMLWLAIIVVIIVVVAVTMMMMRGRGGTPGTDEGPEVDEPVEVEAADAEVEQEKPEIEIEERYVT
jgi:PKD repeat protein